jgi:hypothetical protein
MLIARVHWRLCAGNHPTVWYAALTIAALKQAQSSLVGPICGSHRLETGLSADRRRRTGLGSNIENGARHGNRHQAETAFHFLTDTACRLLLLFLIPATKDIVRFPA